jgi:hypothetical protein
MLQGLELERHVTPLPGKVLKNARDRTIGGCFGHPFALLGFRPHFF